MKKDLLLSFIFLNLLEFGHVRTDVDIITEKWSLGVVFSLYGV